MFRRQLMSMLVVVVAGVYGASYGWWLNSAEAAVLPVSGLVSQWSAENSALDSNGSNHGALINGATYATGKSGQAFSLNGTNSYVEVPDSPSLTISGNFSLNLWVKYNSVRSGTGGNLPNVFIGHDQGGGSVPKWVFFSAVDGLYLHLNGSRSVWIGPVAFAPQTGTWYNISVTKSETLYSFYVNGGLAGTVTDSNTYPDVSGPLTIGKAEELGFFDGLLDEIALYNRALSAVEVQDIYTQTSTPTSTAFTISTTVSPTAGGSVSCNPSSVTSGSSTTCTATASSGYSFTGWSGDCSGSSTTCTLINVTTSKSVTANFTATISAAITSSVQAWDCLFGWAEQNYAAYFQPVAPLSGTYTPYYYRFYGQSGAYLAVSSSDSHLYYLGPLTSNAILDLGAVSQWLATSGCNGEVVSSSGGVSVMLPSTASPSNVGVTQGTGSGLVSSGQQAVGSSIKISLAGTSQTARGSTSISFPVTNSMTSTDSLIVMLKSPKGTLYPVMGYYDPASKTYKVIMNGLANGWEMQLVSDAAMKVRSTTRSLLRSTGSDTCLFDIVDSNSPNIPESDVDVFQQAAEGSCRDYVQMGFKEPSLPIIPSRGKRIIHISSAQDVLSGAGGTYTASREPEAPGLIGQIYINYDEYKTTSGNESKIKNSIAHEMFHAVQHSYETSKPQFVFDTGLNDGSGGFSAYSSAAYMDGTANMIGYTYATRNSVAGTDTSVNLEWSAAPLMLDEAMDAYSYVDGGPYRRQDFFQYVAKHYRGGKYDYLPLMFQKLHQGVSALTATADENTSDPVVAASVKAFLAGYRNGVDAAFRQSFNGTGLPEAYAFFVLDRAYLHSRDAQLFMDDASLGENTLNTSLFKSSIPSWYPDINSSIVLDGIPPLSTRVVRFKALPNASQTPLTINISVEGGELKEKGVRIVFIPESGGNGAPGILEQMQIANGSTMSIPATEPVWATIFLINSHIEDKTAKVTLSLDNSQISITSISPTSGPVGTSIIINGRGFGTTQGAVTIQPSNALGKAATVTSWSDTKITATIPTGAKTGVIVITKSGGSQNSVNEAPTFTVTVPTTPVVGGNCSVTVTKYCDDCRYSSQELGVIWAQVDGATTKLVLCDRTCNTATQTFTSKVILTSSDGYESLFTGWGSSGNSSITYSCTGSTTSSVTANYTSWSW